MRRLKHATAVLAGLLALAPAPTIARAAAPPATQWSLGPAAASKAVHGNLRPAPGIHSQARVFDGLTAYVACPAPSLAGSFTVEAWIALAAYPWTYCPIADHQSQHKLGWSLGIDAEGHLALQAALPDGWHQAVSQDRIPLRRWVHVAGVFDATTGLALYIDGRPVADLAAKGSLTPAGKLDLLIGRSREQNRPAGVIRPAASPPIFDYLDGALSDLRIIDEAMTRAEIENGARIPTTAPRPAAVRPRPPESRPPGRTVRSLLYHPKELPGMGRPLAGSRTPRRRHPLRPGGLSLRLLARHRIRPLLGDRRGHLVHQ